MMTKLLLIIQTLIFGSCENFLDVGVPKDRMTKEYVFNDDSSATSAVIGIYSDMMQTFRFIGSNITWYAGLSSDELSFLGSSPTYVQFYQNLIAIDNSELSNCWDQGYKYIYYANASIDGITNSVSLSPDVRDQLLGEVLFIRAFTYFYLTNLFGDVPKVTSTDQRINANLARSSESDIYDLIVKDLEEAIELLEDKNITTEKVRPDKWAAKTLLARVYLYLENWDQAFSVADDIIESKKFSLEEIDRTFFKTSKETIWQLMPVNPSYNTLVAFRLVPINNTRLPAFPLAEELVQSFEDFDNRKELWIGQTFTSSGDYHYANKYKIRSGGSPLEEYYIVFRLAEVYLIRAEAGVHLNNNEKALEDLNVLRGRAGISKLTNTTSNILESIAEERRKELFVEWGHRWFDLKRTERLDAVMEIAKPTWKVNATLWPIPLSQINTNPKLVQNPGYN